MAAAQSFSASASPTTVSTDEFVTIRYELKNINNLTDFTAPDLANFQLVSGPNQESGMSNMNGVTTQYFAISFIVKPNKPGTFKIPGASVTANNKKISSNPITIIVSKGSGKKQPQQQPGTAAQGNPFSFLDPPPPRQRDVDLNDFILKPGENIAEKVNRNMQMRLVTDKTVCYVGEPIVATYEFYTRLKGESRITKNPSFNGFSVIDFPSAQNEGSSIASLKGREYNKYIVRKSQLYALQPGQMQLEVATLENDIQFLKQGARTADYFDDIRSGNGSFITQKLTLSSKPVTITVKPLPEQGKPLNFHGAVGSFNIAASVENKFLSTDGSGRLKVTIMGVGNLHLVTQPEINWPAGLEGYEAEVVDNIDKEDVPLRGTKSFVFDFNIAKPGSYTIPPVTFSYFDPATATYHTVKSDPVAIEVTQGLKKAISAEQGKTVKGDTAFLESMRIAGYVLVALLLLLVIYYAIRGANKTRQQKTDNDTYEEEIRPLNEPASLAPVAFTESLVALPSQNPLKDSALCLQQNNCDSFYSTLNRELKDYFSARLQIGLLDVSLQNIQQAFEDKGMESQLYHRVEALFKSIELQLYTPYSQQEVMDRSFEEASLIIAETDLYLKKITQ